jgi:hypothetical protein
MVYFNTPITTNCITKESGSKKAVSTVATLVRIHLVSMLDVYELLKNVSRSWVKAKGNKTVEASSLFGHRISVWGGRLAKNELHINQ